jgi:glutamate synthase (NADPH/NADH) large chain
LNDLEGKKMNGKYEQQGLYRSEYEHDACGVGMVANLSGEASHDIVAKGMTILKRLMHRGATGNDPETGDGAGLLMRIPHGFFKKVLGKSLTQRRRGAECAETFGVAMIFGGDGEEGKIEEIVKSEGCEVLGWRDVPTNPDAIGHDARSVMPRIRQVFISAHSATLGTRSARLGSLQSASPACAAVTRLCVKDNNDFERRLYIIRREIEKATKDTYVCSCSSRTIVYKGLLLATQIEKFYPDLSDQDFISPFAIVHQRYSTNTFPTWELAHPFRAIAHNGEINAIKGNLTALAAREASLESPTFGDDLKKILPIVHGGQSDSASLDNIFELLVAAGRDAPHAMMMLVPQAWGAKYHMGHDVRAFYEYHSALMEPWDGPAAVAFTDGLGLGATLDRNGLRPARWTLTKHGLFVLASETGVLDIAPGDIERHGRLKPGAILWLDLEKHRLMEDAEIKNSYARRRPYRRWVKENQIPVTGLFTEIVPSKPDAGDETAAAQRQRFGWSLEDVELILRPMAETGHEPVGAMGNDAALACLRELKVESEKLKVGGRASNVECRKSGHFRLFDCFHQLFAQVTNPPIDPIREELVMSIMTYIGNEGNILAETPGHARLVKMTRPVLTDDELKRMRNIPDFPAKTLSMYFEGELKSALDALAADALAAVKEGAKILILSDRGFYAGKVIPSLLAVAAVNKALVEAGARPSVSIVVESGEVREVHHFAVLLGFGATAVNPYLALATVTEIGKDDTVKAAANYVTAVCKGLMKIMSKMGISTLRSYRSARIFEAVGLGPKIMAEYFDGVTSPVGGLEIEDIEELLAAKNAKNTKIDAGGEYRTRNGGEEHLWTPQRLVDFRESVRHDDYARFKRYTDDIDQKSRVTLRSQLEFEKRVTGNGERIPRAKRVAEGDALAGVGMGDVEPVDSIVHHFVGGAMSLGSLSPEAHETIALALNGLGTMSNSGEGGENPERFGTEKNSAIKQVASGRFGVTIEYLRSAKDLQIKLAQGAKPGEGGQLPAHKVDEFVARLRHAKPGTTLISPPPHHDIYSIEDLAQLIYDLKCANPEARVSVKLVSEAGVGTIAAGVAKAHADVVVISGFDGGTGAAPLTSMKHAGLPWEVGLAEAHQTLVKNNLRHRVKLQVDGQLRTGRDIVIAAMLGADEFAFGTSMLVSIGCVQCRNCNLNCCPVGIATQRKELRCKFAGKPEHLQRYFRFLAEEVREHLAALGLKSLAEARGRADLLKAKDGTSFDFSEMLASEEIGNSTLQLETPTPTIKENYDFRELIPAVEKGETEISRNISNCDRSVGTALSGWLIGEWGMGNGERNIEVNFNGVAGQSFGAFLARGVTFNLVGEANDYIGKGISGGIITIRPPKSDIAPEGNVIAGNVIAYGGTSGAIFLNGQAGERFGIRNSGVTLVAEGIGDHGCEYMTGGKVLVLGSTGVNFGAGMTGGVAYVIDEAGDFDLKCNLDSIDLAGIAENSDDEQEVLALIREHAERTGSPLAARILENWSAYRPKFVKVIPTKG